MNMSAAKDAARIAALLALLGVAACNTIEGVGEDVQEGGEAVEDAARDANPDKKP